MYIFDTKLASYMAFFAVSFVIFYGIILILSYAIYKIIRKKMFGHKWRLAIAFWVISVFFLLSSWSVHRDFNNWKRIDTWETYADFLLITLVLFGVAIFMTLKRLWERRNTSIERTSTEKVPENKPIKKIGEN